jgi:hypothetical protein
MEMTSALSIVNQFTLEGLESRDGKTFFTGRPSKPGLPSVGDYVVLLMGLGEQVNGEVTEVKPDEGTATLSSKDSPIPAWVVRGSTFPMFDSYWVNRVRFILNPSVPWTRRQFDYPDAFEQPSPHGGRMWRQVEPGDETRTDGKIVPGGWDHEHCEICCGKIGASGDAEGCVSGNNWVCVRCFEKYVQPRDLSFVLYGAQDDSLTEQQRTYLKMNELIDNYDLQGIRAFVEGGADVNVGSEFGYSPLTLAGKRGHISLLSLLLELGADLNAGSDHGYTALANAALAGHYPATKLLLGAGASVQTKLCGGSLLTLVKMGRLDSDPRIAEMLRAAGAK